MVSSHPMEQVLKDFESKMGKLETEIHKDMYSERLDVRIKCKITNNHYAFAFYSKADEEELAKQTKWHLDKIEDKIYTARGKHLTDSYSFYPDPKSAPPWTTTAYHSGGVIGGTPVGKSSVSGKTMYDERSIEDIQRAADEEAKKRKIIEAAKMAEAEAKRKEEEAKRKEAYDGNASFGTF